MNCILLSIASKDPVVNSESCCSDAHSVDAFSAMLTLKGSVHAKEGFLELPKVLPQYSTFSTINASESLVIVRSIGCCYRRRAALSIIET